MTKILAHRGFRSRFPENTLLAFEKALEIGAHGLELDVHYSKDGEIMVFHDFELERLTGEKGMIFDYTYKELRQLKVRQFELSDQIPTLKEVLDLFEEYEKKQPLAESRILNIEFKAGSQLYPDIERRVFELCENHSGVIYSSFDHHALVKMKSICQDAKTGVLTASAMVNPWQYMEQLKADYYHPHYFSLSPDNLDDLIKHHVALNPYTVNDLPTAKRLIAEEVHAIITDYPDRLLKCLML